MPKLITKISLKFITFPFLLLCFAWAYGQEIPDSIRIEMSKLKDREKVDFLGNLCWKVRESDRDLSLICGRMAVEMSDSLCLLGEEAKYSNFLGTTLLYYHSKPTEALKYLNRAFEVAVEIRDSVQIGYAFNNMGDVFSLVGNIPLAQAYADSSLYYFERLNNAQGVAYSYINLGKVFLQKKDYPEALTYYQKAIDLYPRHRSESIVSTSNIGIAHVYREMGDLDKALDYYLKDLGLTNRMGVKTFHGSTLTWIANIQAEQGKYAEALQNYNQAMKFFDERNYSLGIVDVHLGKALVFARLKRINDGKAELEQATTTARALKLPSTILEVEKKRLKFYDILGEKPVGSKLVEDFVAVYDSILLVQQYETIGEIRKNSEVNKHLQQVDTKYKDKKNEAFNLWLLAAFSGVLVILLVYRYFKDLRLNRELKALIAGKDKLFSIISHDLRNPFVAIIQYLDLLKSGYLNIDERLDFINQLDLITTNTYTLLDNLLNFSAFRTVKPKLSPGNINLNKLMELVEDTLHATLVQKNINIVMQTENKQVFADKRMLEVVLRNLVSNAVKYSPHDKSIIVKSIQPDHEYVIEVIDFGIGMTKEVAQKLFNDVSPGSRPGTNGESGTGIGLQICREFVAMHNGRLTVDSVPGQGSTFRIHLPLEPVK